MAAGDRTDKIFGRVQLTLGTLTNDKQLAAVMKKVPNQLIYDTIDDFQRVVAESYLCIEGSGTLVVSSGAVVEPSGFFRMKQIVLGTGSTIQPTELDVSEYDALSRLAPTTTGAEEYFKRWAGTLTFYTLDDDSYTAYFYKVPATNVTTAIDPETPQTFDRAIEYGVIARLAPLVERLDLVPIYMTLYDNECVRALNAWRGTKDKEYNITYHDF